MTDDELNDLTNDYDEHTNRNLNDGYIGGEIGYEDTVPYKSSHSPRSRQMKNEYNNQWD